MRLRSVRKTFTMVKSISKEGSRVGRRAGTKSKNRKRYQGLTKGIVPRERRRFNNQKIQIETKTTA